MDMKLARTILAVGAILTPAALASSSASAATYGTNLVVNGDAETGTSAGFTTTGEFSALAYGSSGGFPAPGDPGVSQGGSYFFYGGNDAANSSGSQTIDLSANEAAINSGGVDYNLSALLGGYSSQDDNAVITASFLSVTGLTLGVGTIGPVTAADRSDETGLLARSATGLVPEGASSVDLTVALTRLEGANNDGYADNISFAINPAVSAAPEPSTWLLMFAGIAGIGLMLRLARKSVGFRFKDAFST